VERLYVAFGRGLRKARVDANLTQRELAGRVGLARTSITNIERGAQHVSLHHLFLLSSAVGLQPEKLLPDEQVTLSDLVPAGALDKLQADDEERDFAARVLSKASAVGHGPAGAST
jgi:transcriptional regulator with XRE-family HTH domain